MKTRKGAEPVLSRAMMRTFFERFVRRQFPSGTRLERLTFEEVGTFRFKHALHWVLKLRKPSGETVRVAIRGNIPSKDTRQEVHVANRVLRVLGKRGFAIGELRAPASLGVLPKLRLNLYENFPGDTLKSLIQRRDPRVAFVARQAGAWLAVFHAKRIQVSPKRTAARIREESKYFQDDVSCLAPEFSGAMIRLLEAAVRAQLKIMRQYRRYFRTIHGDLNLGNIVAGRDRSVGFIDFGSSWSFDPLSDLGNFLAQVDLLVWTKQCSIAMAETITRALLDSYKRHRPSIGGDFAKRLDLHRAWWTLQVIAYSLSTIPHFDHRIVSKALAKASVFLSRNGFAPRPPLISGTRREFRKALTDETTMLSYFASHVSQFFPGSQKIEGIAVAHQDALSATSFLTRTVLTLRLPNGMVVKKYVRGNHVTPETYTMMKALSTAEVRPLEVLRPLCYESRFSYVFYEELGGVSFRTSNVRSSRYAPSLRAIAKALATFHNIPSSGLRKLSWDDERSFLRTLGSLITRFSSHEAPSALPALRRLAIAEKTVWLKQPKLIHNDFQASNILLTRRGIGIIDYTRSGVGNPGIDVANFRSHLYIMLDGLLPLRRIERFVALFTSTYVQSFRGSRFTLLESLPAFELRSTLDILATTLTNLGKRDPNRGRYVRLLERRITYLMEQLRP